MHQISAELKERQQEMSRNVGPPSPWDFEEDSPGGGALNLRVCQAIALLDRLTRYNWDIWKPKNKRKRR